MSVKLAIQWSGSCTNFIPGLDAIVMPILKGVGQKGSQQVFAEFVYMAPFVTTYQYGSFIPLSWQKCNSQVSNLDSVVLGQAKKFFSFSSHRILKSTQDAQMILIFGTTAI